MKVEYHICKFPSYQGTPWIVKNYWLALILANLRNGFGLRLCEIIVIKKDSK